MQVKSNYVQYTEKIKTKCFIKIGIFILKKKKLKIIVIIIIPSYVYCARLTETCHGTCILLLSRWSDCFYCSHLYVALDKASAK